MVKKIIYVKKVQKLAIGWLWGIQLQTEVMSNQKQCSSQKGHGGKRCEIQGDRQEMAVMVG